MNLPVAKKKEKLMDGLWLNVIRKVYWVFAFAVQKYLIFSEWDTFEKVARYVLSNMFPKNFSEFFPFCL